MVLPGLSESFATGLPLHSTSFMTMFSGFTGGYHRLSAYQFRNSGSPAMRSGDKGRRLSPGQGYRRRPAPYSWDRYPVFRNGRWLSHPIQPGPRNHGANPVAFGKLRAKVAQERVHGNAVGKGNTQPIRVFLKPRGEGGALAVGKVRADLLVRPGTIRAPGYPSALNQGDAPDRSYWCQRTTAPVADV